MWKELEQEFENKPSQLKVVNLLLEYGFAVKEEGGKGRVYAADIELPISKVARAAGVDRKVVDTTLETIITKIYLKAVFQRLKPVANIVEVARHAKNEGEQAEYLTRYTGRGVMEIDALSDSKGIAAEATSLLAENGLSINFILAKDPKLSVKSTMVIVTDGDIPGKVVDQLLRNPDILTVSLS